MLCLEEMGVALLGGAVQGQAEVEAWVEGAGVAVEWEEHGPELGPAGIASVPTAALESLTRWELPATI
jgi:hypothetical protein